MAKKLSEVVVNEVNMIDRIMDSIDSKYPYSIKKLLDTEYVKLDNKEDLLFNNIENYFSYLQSLKKLCAFNVSHIGILLFNKNENIRNILLKSNIHQNKNDFDLLNKQIEFELNSINLNEVNDLLNNNLIVKTEDISDQNIDFKSYTELYNYIINLMEKYSFMYSDFIIRFFDSLDIDVAFKIRKSVFNKSPIVSKKRLLDLLNELNCLFFVAFELFKKDGEFLFDLITKYYFIDKKDVNYFITKRFTSLDSDCNSFRNAQLEINRCFTSGITRLRPFYIIEYQEYSNINNNSFRTFCLDKKLELIKNISENLNEDTIKTIFEIRKFKIKEITKSSHLLFKLSTLEKDIMENSNNITIKKQELSNQSQTIVADIKKDISNYYKKEFKEFEISIKENKLFNDISIMDLITLEVIHNGILFKIKLKQINLKMCTYVYIGNKLIDKSILYRKEDFERCFLCIKNYGNNQ